MKWKSSKDIVSADSGQIQVTSVSFRVHSDDVLLHKEEIRPRFNSVDNKVELSSENAPENAIFSISAVRSGELSAEEEARKIPSDPFSDSQHSVLPVMANGVQNPAEFSSTLQLITESEITQGSKSILLDSCCLIALSLGLNNIWRLPTVIYFNYPGEIFIAYLFLMFLVGLPLMILELSLGQFGRTGMIQLWRAVPLFKGVGIAQFIAGFYLCLYWPSLMSWAFQFGVTGIGDWNTCKDDLNLTSCSCFVSSDNCSSYLDISMEEACFKSAVLNQGTNHMNYKLLPMLAVGMILITLGGCFGEKMVKCLTAFSGFLVLVLLSACLALALSHPNNNNNNNNNFTAYHGLALLIPSQLWAFGQAEVWYGAMVQTLFSLNIGFALLPSMTCSIDFRRNIIKHGVIIWLINLMLSILSIITIFAWIGISGLNNQNIIEQNGFIYYIYYHISDSLWAGLSFALLFFAGFISMIPQFYSTVRNLQELFPKFNHYHWQTCATLCILIALLNIPCLLQSGSFVITLWDHIAAGGAVLTCLILHVIGWAWIYRGNRLNKDIAFMVQRPVNGFLLGTIWLTVIIGLLEVAELWGFIGLPLDGTSQCKYPAWLTAVGWTMYLIAIATVLLVMVWVFLYQVDYGLKKKLISSIRPLRTWGPNDPILHLHWKTALFTDDITSPNMKDTYSRPHILPRTRNHSENLPNLNNVQNSIKKSEDLTLQRLSSKRQYVADSFIQ